ncbi:MAG TPA: glycosyltransferase family 39 protein [Blastocatellia bacterium]|nr:glycosyltransferase family 39 protein [Blastocatellia bacterium]
MAAKIDKRDLPWVALIALSFIVGLAVSWQRWGNMLVDCGREMNQPLRLARGEMLYSEVRHIYGPLSPYLNATLYRVFGPSLGVLYAEGIITAIIILALVYYIARQLMNRAASTAATLSVVWLCAFKQAGNYFLPYSYSALHGCALGLVTLALIVRFIQAEKRRRDTSPRLLGVAGLAAGLTLLAKTEMGLAAVVTGIVAVVLVAYPNMRLVLRSTAIFLGPAVLIVLAVYGYIASQVGWHTLSTDSFLFLRHLPEELVYFNKRMSGFDSPGESLVQMIGMAARVAALAVIIGVISILVTRRKGPHPARKIAIAETATGAGRATYTQLWILLAASLLLFVLIPSTGQVKWDKGPYLAMPLLLVGLLVPAVIKYQKQKAEGREGWNQTVLLVVIAVYALASLARVMLRVRSGGAYSSYLLPASVIIFVYIWVGPFANIFRERRTRRVARNIIIGALMLHAVITAGVLGYRYRSRNTYTLATQRGTTIAVPDLGQGFEEALEFIERETAIGEPVAIMPEGTSLNFLTDRPNPLREEITTPGFLDPQGEERAINQLIASNTRFVLVTNRPTAEFGPEVLGRDYHQTLMRWVEENFEPFAVFGPEHDPASQIGDKIFFIRAYKKRNER